MQPLTSRVFGKVDEYGGELCASTFIHLWFLPLLPTGSLWISSLGSQPMAQRIRWQWRSIVAAYLRAWMPLIWASGFSNDTPVSYCLAAAGLALFAWSWTWRMAHRTGAQLRHDFDLVALGSQCPPEALPAATRDRLLALKQRAFATASSDRTPEDVARFGGTSIDELIAAYAVLRLVAAQNQPSGPWRLLAQRILDGKHEQPDGEGGAFRSGAGGKPVELAALHEHVRGAARALRASAIVSAADAPKTWMQNVMWGGFHRMVGYSLLGGIAVFGALVLANLNDPDRYSVVTERRLRNTIGEGQREYRVECEELIPFRASERPAEGVLDVHLCRLGKKLLPVLSEAGEGIRGKVVRGRLIPRRVFSASKPEWEVELAASPYDAQLTVVYLTTDVFTKAGQIALALASMLGSLLLLGLWERVRRQRERMIAEAERELRTRAEAAST